LQALLPFFIVLALVIGTSKLLPAVHGPLSALKATLAIYPGAGGKALSFSWLLTPGVLILISVLLSCLLQRRKLSLLRSLAGEAARQSGSLAITILSIVAMAKVMNYSGMTDSIALMLIRALGSAYPLAAPFIGAMGTFVTGSDTTCCILFGNLQLEAAKAVGADPLWLVASNLSGATAGKMISPQSIAVAVATAGLGGKDGEILRGTLAYCLVYLVLICLITFAGAEVLRAGA
jgi:lactate permease